MSPNDLQRRPVEEDRDEERSWGGWRYFRGWSKGLEVVEAAKRMGLSYRQAKRLWKRYRAQGSGIGAPRGGDDRAKPRRFRRRVIAGAEEVVGQGGGALWADAGGGAPGGGKTGLGGCGDAAALDVGRGVVEPGSGGGDHTGEDGSASSTLGSWCKWTEIFTTGWKNGGRKVA